MYGVGIDLGTTFTAAAVSSAGTLDMVPLNGQATVTPSVAYVDENGSLLTGEVADRLGRQHPDRMAREFKRSLGNPTPVTLAGVPHSPTDLMAALLRSVLDRVSQAQGGPADDILLTHPAVWGQYRREQFEAIARLAGLPHPSAAHPDAQTTPSGSPTVRTVTEPVAAATYYCSTRPLPPNSLLAVYDLGGGTFDGAVVRNDPDGLEIVGTPEGIEWLGGADFDQAILDHVDRRLNGAITALDRADPATSVILAALHRECTFAKEALSTREQANVRVPLPGGARDVDITRDAFERMITPSLVATVEAFRRTLATADVAPADLAAVLLVGGSSQIPKVAELLRDALRRPIVINTHPKHAVALGAAMLSTRTLKGTSSTRRTTPSSATGPATSATPPAAAAALTGDLPAAQPVAANGQTSPGAPGSGKGADKVPGWHPTSLVALLSRVGSRRILLPLVAVAVLALSGISLFASRPEMFQLGAQASSATAPAKTTARSTAPSPTAGAYFPRASTSTSPKATTPTSTKATTPTSTKATTRTSTKATVRPLTKATTPSPTAAKTPTTVPAGGTGVIRGLASKLCVDSDSNPARIYGGTPLGGHAFAGDCNGTDTQKWHEGQPLSRDEVPGDGWYRLIDQGTGFCLDSSVAGDVYTLPCLDPDHHQVWKRTGPSGSKIAYRNLATDRCLDLSSSGSTLQTTPCPTGDTWPKTMLFQRRP